MDFNDQIIYENYKKILANTSSKDSLTKLWKIDPILFDPNFIANMIALAEKNEYKIDNFDDISSLRKSSVFRDFIKQTTDALITKFDFLFEIYFQAITEQTRKPSSVIKTRILTLLKLQLNIPSINNSINFKNSIINVSSSYKPKETERATAACDIAIMVENMFYSAIKNAPSQTFTYSSQPSTLTLQGPILKMLLRNIIMLQDELLNAAIACGVKVEPFITNIGNTIKF
uniref:Uncharacterized protein n=1 Tax=Faxonius propinquus nudivirus TaxID=3139431 RepID=A0AAU8GCH1_9VIRU